MKRCLEGSSRRQNASRACSQNHSEESPLQLQESEPFLFCLRTCSHFKLIIPLCSSLQPRTDGHLAASHIRKHNLLLPHLGGLGLLSYSPLSHHSVPPTSNSFPSSLSTPLASSQTFSTAYTLQHPDESLYGETIADSVAEVRELAPNVVRGNLQLRDKCESLLALNCTHFITRVAVSWRSYESSVS